ncbi:head decoration protein [Streptomyces europaeiscabiei]|uniref:head decoration protein n=1 Tax=Streptomyces europaeiscabiei TaxID=146819 RepID=UPI0029A2EFD8|nr:head decoration protein [Streptomyces europaeiscabiei]MDX2528050.1 head decoration protein [Streptomyces europaeiscabiei]MDX3713380.1 head decoration protein [Streptomyces europaeiscabiei]
MNLTQTTESFGQDDQSWLASAHGTDTARSITLDTSTFTSGTHYPNGYFPSGLALGKITATGKYGPYSNAASDGTEVLAGFLMTAIDAPSVNTIDPQGALLWHGAVIEAKLPIAVDSAGKADIAGRLTFF